MTIDSAIGSVEVMPLDPNAGGQPSGTSREERAKVVGELRQRDNVTNFYFIAQVYAVLIATVGVTIWSFGVVADAGLGWWWNIPMSVVAVIIMGATQHQFGGIVHEGTHHILFTDRKLNELVSDWFAAFPIFTSTYAFRIHHLAHHQFVNDPQRDPNFDQARDGGHWLDFPIAHIDLLFAIAKWLWLPNTVRYIHARLRYSSLGGGEKNPYADEKLGGTPWPMRIGVLYAIVMPFMILPLQLANMYFAAGAMLVGVTAACVFYCLLVPESSYPRSRLDPVISHRMTAFGRIVYLAILYGLLTLGEYATGHPTWMYFLLLWIVPIFTTFPLFMILREWFQHGNADRGRYTNSRIMLFNPLLRYAVMPWGMDYHLPHHIIATVPHYNIRKLHEFLLQTDAKYASKVQVVEGWSHKKTSGLPTIVDVLGPEYASDSKDIHIAAEVLEYTDVNDPDGIAAQESASRRDGQK